MLDPPVLAADLSFSNHVPKCPKLMCPNHVPNRASLQNLFTSVEEPKSIQYTEHDFFVYLLDLSQGSCNTGLYFLRVRRTR